MSEMLTPSNAPANGPTPPPPPRSSFEPAPQWQANGNDDLAANVRHGQ